MTNKPIKNDDITVMFSASIGTDYTIEKISNSNHQEIRAALEELQLLNVLENEFNPQEYLKDKDFQLETIISSDGINEDKEIFYDYNVDVDIAKGISATDLPIKKQTEYLINKLSFSQEVLSPEEKLAIINASENINDLDKIQALIDAVAIEGSGIINGGINNQTKELINQAINGQSFDIYQIKLGDQYRDIRFENADYLKSIGKGVVYDNYDLIYSDELGSNMSLEALYEKFNIDRPEDFKGHSLSVSDIIVINNKNESKTYFVDSFGFKESPEFMRGLEMKSEKQKDTKRSSVIDALKETKRKLKAVDKKANTKTKEQQQR